MPIREHSTSSFVPFCVSVKAKLVYVKASRLAVRSGKLPYSVKNSMFTGLLVGVRETGEGAR